MGMPITVEVVDPYVTQAALDAVYDYFRSVDERFSVYKDTSEITRINKGLLTREEASTDMRSIFRLCEETKQLTDGYFDIRKPDGSLDPSGLVKGWAIFHAADLLDRLGFQNFFVDAGSDIQVRGHNTEDKPWAIGIKNPFDQTQIVKTMYLGQNEGVATSGTYIRGQHIYNPKAVQQGPITDIVSLTVIGSNVYEADRFATPAFAMGKEGIRFIERINGLEGYQIDKHGIATMTSGFEKYISS